MVYNFAMLRAHLALACLILFLSPQVFPAEPGIAKVNWSEVRDKLSAALSKRASEKVAATPRIENWEEVEGYSLELRARALFLKKKSGLTDSISNAALDACQALAEAILSLEASRDLVRKSGILKDTAGRGWGTSLVQSFGGLRLSNVLELDLTGTALVALAEYLPLAKGVHEAHYEQVLGTAVETLDYWIQFFMEEHPTYGPFFRKFGVPGESLRDQFFFSSDAQMALALWLVSKELRAKGLEKKAGEFETLSLRLARQIQSAVVEPVFYGKSLNADLWFQGYTGVRSNAKPMRIEDASHASPIVDLVAVFWKNNLSYGGKALFKSSDLAGFREVLTNRVFVRDDEGRVAYRIYYDEDDIKKSGNKTPNVPVHFSTNAGTNSASTNQKKWISAVAWHRSLSSKDRGIDTGQTLRASWGWPAAAKTDEAAISHLYRYYASYFGFWRDVKWSPNAFLTLASFWYACQDL